MNRSWTGRLARACARRAGRTILVWSLVVVAALASAGTLLATALTTEGDVVTEPESVRGFDLLQSRFPERRGVDDYLIVRSEGPDAPVADDPQFSGFVIELRTRVLTTDGVVDVGDPYSAAQPGLVSRDGRAVLLPVTMSQEFTEGEAAIEEVVADVERADSNPAFAVDATGTFTIGHDFLVLSEEDLAKGELRFGLPAALIILLLVFGAVMAALVPLMVAIVSIIVTIGIAAAVGQGFELSFFLVNMVTAMGLALGIDYTLFVLSRYREERANGADPHDAVERAGATASKAVFFSGTSFVVALLGMLLVPDTVLRSLAFGAVVVGVVTVAAALTLLPAVLDRLGDRVNALRIPFVGRHQAEESRFWARGVRRVMRRPGLVLVLTVGALLVLAYPVTDLQTGQSGVSTMPSETVSARGQSALEESFPQGRRAAPVDVVVTGDVRSAKVTTALRRLERELATDEAFGPAQPLEIAPGQQLGVVPVPLTVDPLSTRAQDAIRDLRADYVPAAFTGVDAEVLVTGQTAQTLDYSDLIESWLPVVLAFVLGLSLVLLTLVFRSVVIAAEAVALNLLSVGAAYGLLVLVFQKGVGADLLGITRVEQVEAWLPVFLFSVLFALSMDYHVFLLSRIRERYAQTGDTRDAVVHGIATTARIITGAALIIVAVFVGFATGDLSGFQQMGFGVGVALLLDATVIRMLVVPTSMAVLGRWNWYLPRWLHWLPELHVEGGAGQREPAHAGAGVPRPREHTADEPVAGEPGPHTPPSTDR